MKVLESFEKNNPLHSVICFNNNLFVICFQSDLKLFLGPKLTGYRLNNCKIRKIW